VRKNWQIATQESAILWLLSTNKGIQATALRSAPAIKRLEPAPARASKLAQATAAQTPTR